MPASTPITPASEPPPPLRPRQIQLRMDPLLALAAIGLMVFSVVALKSATADDVPGSPNYYVYRQLGVGIAGVVLMLLCTRLDYSRLRELRYPLYAFMIFANLTVFVVGTGPAGANLWISTPVFNIQPSELGKLLLMITVSAFVVDWLRGPATRQLTARVMLLGLVPAMIVMVQPDLGSSLVYVAGTLGLLFVAGMPWRHFAALGALGLAAMALTLVALPAVGVDVLKDYQKDRLTSFLHPSEVAGDAGYQQAQSVIAIGAGEKTGRGDAATQTGLDFLPEHRTDFIFAVVGETYGFAGAALVLSLYALLLWRGLHILTQAKNLFGALIAGGITVMLLFQIFVNVGMTVGIMPITGVPAPLLSYGGSSMLVTFLSLGLLQSIAAQAKEAGALKARMTVL